MLAVSQLSIHVFVQTAAILVEDDDHCHCVGDHLKVAKRVSEFPRNGMNREE